MIILGVGFAVTMSTIGDLLIAAGMQKVGAISWEGLGKIPSQIVKVLKTPQIPLSVVFMALFFFTWLALLSRADLSYILPMTATTYILNGLAAGPFLGEKVSAKRWLGILVITVGVVFVTLTGSHS
ncbi:MAG: EamA family transporter [Candidatus Eremiobacteraeota bacterium]|nr:EamA family transporter [Candidatus Eremiobacteraeota bacterium]